MLVALDVTSAVIDEAESKKCDFLLSHHPLIFQPVKSLDYSKASDALIMRLIRKGISLYASHTPFDKVSGGVCDTLARKLGLERIQVGEDGFMRAGFLPESMCYKRLIEHIKTALGTGRVNASKSRPKQIRKIAVIGGSGGDFVEAALYTGAQALVTGEAKHHHFIEANEKGLLLITAGHYATERFFIDAAIKSLQSKLDELQLTVEFYKTEGAEPPEECV